MDKFVAEYIEGILVREGNGKYTDDPNDSGGKTRWGITEAVARENGYRGDMRDLPREVAVDIYKKRYWIRPGIHLVGSFLPALAERMLDFGVLAGPDRSVEYLQRCLNVLNRRGKEYPDITLDGVVGGKQTIPALAAFLNRRGDVGGRVLLGMVVSLQSAFLIELAEKREKDEEYEFGWQLNRAIGAIL